MERKAQRDQKVGNIKGSSGSKILVQKGSRFRYVRAGRDSFQIGNIHTGGGDINFSESGTLSTTKNIAADIGLNTDVPRRPFAMKTFKV
jgi:hypothetical protein